MRLRPETRRASARLHPFEPAVNTEGRGDGCIVQEGDKRVPALNVKEDKTGILTVVYQFPGEEVHPLHFRPGYQD